MHSQSIDYANQYKKAAAILKRGGVIAYPTEGVWGLGCDPFNSSAVNRILEIKSRPPHKGLIVVSSEMAHFADFLKGAGTEGIEKIRQSKGRGISWLIANNGLALDLVSGGQSTLAIRLSDHPSIAGICSAFGAAMVSTSANPSAEPPALNAEQVHGYFAERIDYVVPGDLGGQNGPSEIRHIGTGEVMREAGK